MVPGLLLLLQGHTIKLQRNVGKGACFPWHYDNPGRPNKRVLTCLIYLNPDYASGQGGELELMPFLQPPVVIEPKMGRMVFFRSDRVLHRVRPNYHERYALTIWLDGEGLNM